ncbi:MAG: hypothetical protein ACW991_00640 [Candidatus Hodarchaeales archaeon]
MIAHREVGIVGELFVSAMISVAIVHNPYNYNSETTLSKSKRFNLD